MDMAAAKKLVLIYFTTAIVLIPASSAGHGFSLQEKSQ
jgi:hypothetical protein